MMTSVESWFGNVTQAKPTCPYLAVLFCSGDLRWLTTSHSCWHSCLPAQRVLCVPPSSTRSDCPNFGMHHHCAFSFCAYMCVIVICVSMFILAALIRQSLSSVASRGATFSHLCPEYRLPKRHPHEQSWWSYGLVFAGGPEACGAIH